MTVVAINLRFVESIAKRRNGSTDAVSDELLPKNLFHSSVSRISDSTADQPLDASTGGHSIHSTAARNGTNDSIWSRPKHTTLQHFDATTHCTNVSNSVIWRFRGFGLFSFIFRFFFLIINQTLYVLFIVWFMFFFYSFAKQYVTGNPHAYGTQLYTPQLIQTVPLGGDVCQTFLSSQNLHSVNLFLLSIH